MTEFFYTLVGQCYSKALIAQVPGSLNKLSIALRQKDDNNYNNSLQYYLRFRVLVVAVIDAHTYLCKILS